MNFDPAAYPPPTPVYFPPPPPAPKPRRSFKARAVRAAIVTVSCMAGMVGCMAAIDAGTSAPELDAVVPAASEDSITEVTSAPTKSAMDEVSIDVCAMPNDFGYSKTYGSVDNDTSKTSTYWITVRYTSKASGVQVGTGTAIVTDLLPGATAVWEDPFGPEVGLRGLTCDIADVKRYAS